MSPIDNKKKQMEVEDLRQRIENAQDYDELFEIVKRVVEREAGRHRAGLALILADMPNTVGAYHPVGSNTIVLNRALIKAMKQVIRSTSEINSFIFMVLMHEYLHSLGFLSEFDVRKRCQSICRSALGDDHITVRMASGNWLEMYPQLTTILPRMSNTFELVERFDSSSMSYIG